MREEEEGDLDLRFLIYSVHRRREASNEDTMQHSPYGPRGPHGPGCYCLWRFSRFEFQQWAIGRPPAGPAEIEALFANEIDLGYVGPSPAINGYVKSHGQALRIIAGAASGGAEFIVRPGANIKSPSDLSGKKLATPQLGGTQDVSLRYYLQQHGLHPADKGGTVQIVPTDNPNILTLFKQGKIDGAWVPEPWATRLIVEGKGQLFVDERSLWPNGKFVTTEVIVRKAFLDQHPDVVNTFLKAHVDTIQYILRICQPCVCAGLFRTTEARHQRHHLPWPT